MSVPALASHVNGLVAEFAAEYGRVDLVGRRVDCDPGDRDALLDAFEAFGVAGGAGIRVRDADGRVLLAQYDGTDGWVDPGDGRRAGESYADCATRGVAETTGIEATVTGLAQVHVLYMDDWTDRQPAPNPFVSFEGERTGGSLRPGDGVEEVRWFEDLPESEALVYEELSEVTGNV